MSSFLSSDSGVSSKNSSEIKRESETEEDDETDEELDFVRRAKLDPDIRPMMTSSRSVDSVSSMLRKTEKVKNPSGLVVGITL